MHGYCLWPLPFFQASNPWPPSELCRFHMIFNFQHYIKATHHHNTVSRVRRGICFDRLLAAESLPCMFKQWVCSLVISDVPTIMCLRFLSHVYINIVKIHESTSGLI